METVLERRYIAVIVGGGVASDASCAQARSLGHLLVDAGFRVASGGRTGVMEAVSRGARLSEAWREGDVIGILPGLDRGEANPWVDVVIPTGMGQARNVILVAMADVVIAVGGGAGTLSEIAQAWRHGKPIIALMTDEGWASELAGKALDDRRDDIIHGAGDAGQAVALAKALLGLDRPG